ncbi:MAG: hypothetical protein M1409_10265 [Actinobacteria bacterium]|nr:hypothetical protein [Actinomycetota bacterium]
MVKNNETILNWKLKRWQTVLLFGFLLMIVYGAGTYFFDYYAGSATAGFGKMGSVWGIGMFFIYMIGYFLSIVIILPILIHKSFGLGTLIFVPYAIIGFFVEYYYELQQVQALKGVWAVFGWTAIGLLIGLSVDITYRFLTKKISLKIRAIIMSVVLALANFVLTLIALIFFYKIPTPLIPLVPGSFFGVSYFGLPWLVINSGFGGYTAYAISRSFK